MTRKQYLIMDKVALGVGPLAWQLILGWLCGTQTYGLNTLDLVLFTIAVDYSCHLVVFCRESSEVC